MFAEQIEKMKRDYTDKYVVVDGTRPELARFRDVVGRVKTVNMNGRALVEFDEFHLNTGWHDIDPEFLKVVDKPPPKAPKPEVKKAAPAAKEKPAAKPQPATGVPKAGKSSVADILAAARGGKPSGEAAGDKVTAAAGKAKPAPAADKPAAPKVDRSKMSVTDMLAAARAGGATGSAPAAPKVAAAAPAAPAEEAEEESTPKPAPAKKAAPPVAKSSAKIDKSKMSIDDILAWCREHDAK